MLIGLAIDLFAEILQSIFVVLVSPPLLLAAVALLVSEGLLLVRSPQFRRERPEELRQLFCAVPPGGNRYLSLHLRITLEPKEGTHWPLWRWNLHSHHFEVCLVRHFLGLFCLPLPPGVNEILFLLGGFKYLGRMVLIRHLRLLFCHR